MKKGLQTTCGSKMLWNYQAPYDATVVKVLENTGAVCIGKTNMDEFAMGSSNTYSAFYPTRNPWNLSHISGGSSGGSAAAVSAGFIPFALGSDTGGSIRLPASFCGIVGYKPTYGLISRFGLVAFSSSLDQIGTLCRSVRDTAMISELIIGKDKRDPKTVERPMKLLASVEESIAKKRIGIINETIPENIDPNVRKAFLDAVNVFRSLGCIVEEVSFPEMRYVIPTYYIIAPAEASSNLAKFDGIRYGFHVVEESTENTYISTRQIGFGEEVKRRLLLGTFTLSTTYYDSYYEKALKVRRIITENIRTLFSRYDALISPTAPCEPYLINETVTPLSFYMMDVNTVLANLAGLPAISVPMSFHNAKPVGLHIQCKAFDDALALNIARAYEKSAGFFEDEHYPFPNLETQDGV
jgi:aspartyl-tRNA(Asn)/glutamyl-tRNA(Gln) amidotransferase subunit A